MIYGNYSMGYSYSPDRSRDVDRFNPATAGNRPASYNPHGWYSPARKIYSESTMPKRTGWYDGGGGYHEE